MELAAARSWPRRAATMLTMMLAACGSDGTGSFGRDEDASLGPGAPEAGGGADASDAECDLRGLWIARQVTESLALGLPQYASTWYYLVLDQQGEQLSVTQHMDCGIQVRGTVQVQLKPATTRALIERNSQVGRQGTVKKQADGSCALELETFWSARGLSESDYLPSPRSRAISIEELQVEKPLPTDGSLSEDWDGDGKPGVSWVISGLASGERYSVQRDWTRWFSAPQYAIVPSADFASDLLIRAEFSVEEVIYEATSPTLRSGSTANGGAEHTVKLRFLGRSEDDPRAAAVVKEDPFETCLAIQAALPAPQGLK